jgi:DNA-binding IclR family transcriptional regulator
LLFGAKKIIAENCTAVHLLAKVLAMNATELSAHVLSVLARAQSEGSTASLDTLTQELRVRRGDVRRTVTLLHRQGFVDALRMRLTLQGFALGRAYLSQALPPLRRLSTKSALQTAAA